MSNYGSFDIKGLKELEQAITEKYSGAKTSRIINTAIKGGTEVFADRLKSEVGSFKDKGYEQAEIVTTDPRKTAEGRKAKVGWNGPHNRYALVHLNEFGYTKKGKQYTPRGFGAIDKTIRQTEDEYYAKVAQGMKEML